jgi:hypothetical protein
MTTIKRERSAIICHNCQKILKSLVGAVIVIAEGLVFCDEDCHERWERKEEANGRTTDNR